MPLGEDQMIVTRIFWPLEVQGEVAVEQHRDQVGGRHRGGRVTRTSRSAGTYRVHPQLLRQLPTEVAIRHINSSSRERDAAIRTGHRAEICSVVRVPPTIAQKRPDQPEFKKWPAAANLVSSQCQLSTRYWSNGC